jgi:cytoskeletal protein CcmA (bactofilin family)
MLTSLLELAGIAGVLIAAATFVAAFRRARSGAAVVCSVVALLATLPWLLAPTAAGALEVRHGDLIAVAAGETIDDTLVALGENVSIDGDVHGDLIAFARRVTVRGNITGNVVAAGETVSLAGGTIGGGVFSAGRSVELTRVSVARNFYGAGRDVSLGSGADVGGNAIVAGSTAVIDGSVGIDLYGAGAEIAIGGNVERNVETHSRKITVLAPARVHGNLTAHLGRDEDLEIAPGATIGGNVSRDIGESAFATKPPTTKFVSVGFYVAQVLRVVAAFLAGLLLLWLAPGLRTVRLRGTADVLKAAGFGLVAAVTLPVAALIACVTIIGIPLGVIGFLLWLLGLYFAKIVLAQTIGSRLFDAQGATPHHAATLLSGLVIVVIVVNLPFVGGLANLALTLIGLGMLVRYAVGATSSNELLA